MAALRNGRQASATELRQRIYGEGREPDREDVLKLINLGRSEGADPDFAALLSEVALDVFAVQVDPTGYVTNYDAAWLIARLAEGGGLSSAAEFELLKTLIGHAISVPPALTEFAVREVEKAILTGRRDAFGGEDHAPGIVTPADVDALRALAFAPTRGHSLHVDRNTAEALFDIAHATATADNAPEFPEFFSRAIGNYLMGADFLGTPDASEVLQVEAELARPASGFGAFLSAAIHGRRDLRAAWESLAAGEEEVAREINAATDRRLDAASRIETDAAQWVIAHLSRGGELTLAERRLLAFLRDEAASAPPELEALYAQAA
jgi:hypothetical protein